MAGLGETGRGGGLARTRNPVLRADSGSAGRPARKQGFNTEAQRAQRSRRSKDFGASRDFTSRHWARHMHSCSAMAACARRGIGVAARVAGARRPGRAGGAGGTVGWGVGDSMRGDAKAAGGSRFKGSVREDLKRTVGLGFAGVMRGDAKATGGSRFKGSVRKGSKRAVGLGFTGAMRKLRAAHGSKDLYGMV